MDCIYRNGDITGYSVRVMRNGDVLRIVYANDTQNVTISELSPYNISVAAVNRNGTGVYSDHIATTTERKQCHILCTLLKPLLHAIAPSSCVQVQWN